MDEIRDLEAQLGAEALSGMRVRFKISPDGDYWEGVVTEARKDGSVVVEVSAFAIYPPENGGETGTVTAQVVIDSREVEIVEP
jgi:hypothetical protein